MKVSNDDGEYKRSLREIFPPEFEHNKENDINTEGSFLDLGIKIKDNRFSISLYDNKALFSLSLLECLIYAAIFLLKYLPCI